MSVKHNLGGLYTKLEFPSFNLERSHQSFRYLVSKLRNALPQMVRESSDILFFNRALTVNMT